MSQTAALLPDAPTAPAPDVRVSLADADRDAAIGRAVAILQREGVVVLDDLVDPALIARARDQVEAAHPAMIELDPDRCFQHAERRHSVPLVIDGALADPAICIAPAVETIAARLLGEAYKVDSMALLVSAPGAPDQPRHCDGALFPETVIDRLLPPFAFAFALPLVAMDEASGRTAFWAGSHRNPRLVEHPWTVAETVPSGSAILWDYRVRHQGLANRGPRPRLVLFATLAREWWMESDPLRAADFERLRMARAVHAGLPPEIQRRFSRAKLIDTTETLC